jgi:hypothetical protein
MTDAGMKEPAGARVFVAVPDNYYELSPEEQDAACDAIADALIAALNRREHDRSAPEAKT